MIQAILSLIGFSCPHRPGAGREVDENGRTWFRCMVCLALVQSDLPTDAEVGILPPRQIAWELETEPETALDRFRAASPVVELKRRVR